MSGGLISKSGWNQSISRAFAGLMMLKEKLPPQLIDAGALVMAAE
jgi:hypothetical protein